MLVLSRKIGERIVLPETGVRIAVLGVKGKRVRLGIEAPREATVHREEVWQRIPGPACPTLEDIPTDEATCECSTL
jgi:carbon storage regulator